MDIKITRGDTRPLTFSILADNGESYVLSDKDKLYFTVKRNWYCKECVLQKTYGDGIRYNEETQEYEIELTHDCTCGLECCDYVFDIQLNIGSQTPVYVETLAKGNFVIDVEATHKENEV